MPNKTHKIYRCYKCDIKVVGSSIKMPAGWVLAGGADNPFVCHPCQAWNKRYQKH